MVEFHQLVHTKFHSHRPDRNHLRRRYIFSQEPMGSRLLSSCLRLARSLEVIDLGNETGFDSGPLETELDFGGLGMVKSKMKSGSSGGKRVRHECFEGQMMSRLGGGLKGLAQGITLKEVETPGWRQ